MDPQTPIKIKNVICPDAPKKNYHKRIARTLFVITKNLTEDFRGETAEGKPPRGNRPSRGDFDAPHAEV